MGNIWNSISNFVNGRGTSVEALDTETQEMFALKRTLLTQIRADAGSEMPTLEAYRQSFMNHPQVQAMLNDGRIKPEHLNDVAADLSKQDLSGFKLIEPKANEDFKRRQFETGKHDVWDQDSNGTINVAATSPFYDKINLSGANLDRSFVEPSGSFKDQIPKAGNRNDMTFQGLIDGDTFTFAAGEYTGTKITDIDGGGLHFATGTRVHGLELNGKTATIEIEANARVENISTNDYFRIVTLNSKGTIANSDLSNAVVGQNSNLRGATLQDVTLGEVNGVDLSGVTLNNLKIIDKQGTIHAIQKVADLEARGVHADATTRISASPAFLQEHRTAKLQEELGGVIAKLKVAINTDTPISAPAQLPPQTNVARNESQGVDRSYYARMSATGGRPA